MIKNNQKLTSLYVATLPFLFSGDLLVIGAMIFCMGVYFDNAATIFFGVYDMTLGAVFVRNTIKYGD
jgi:hypothetical protein